MPTAIISDIHSNLDALNVVLADIDARGIDCILCLGDIIGYGPNPLECVDLVIQRCQWSLMGNHDFAILYEPTSFNASAEAAAFWTRFQFELEQDEAVRRKRWEYLASLSIRQVFNGALCVHASPRRPINEYIFPDDVISAPAKMNAIFDRIKQVAFVGHTHVAGVFTDEPDFYPPDDLGEAYAFNDHEKCVINPGSVGQPRDRDPRSSYAIVYEPEDGETSNSVTGFARVEFIRLEYDIEAVVAKVHCIDELNDFLAMRLLEGR